MPNTPWVLGGTKMDLIEDPQTLERLGEKNLKPITFEQGAALAKELGAYAFLPYSSMTGQVGYIPPDSLAFH